MSVSDRSIDARAKRLELAARAAWLYYIKGQTQDEVATELGLSRPNAQRLVALAISEGLIRFRLDHPLLHCMELAARMRDRFGLLTCEVAPSAEADGDNRVATAIVAAQVLEGILSSRDPQVLAIGTGRALLETTLQMPLMTRAEDKIVSAVGTLNRDGRASPFDVAMRLAERLGAQCYPMPLPLITDTRAECDFLRAQRGYRVLSDLYERAAAGVLGVGSMGQRAPILVDGFVSAAEMNQLVAAGAVGEILSRGFDRDGAFVDNDVTDRLTAFRLSPDPRRSVILVASGPDKVPPLRAVLKGRYATGIVTDEKTAAALLDRGPKG